MNYSEVLKSQLQRLSWPMALLSFADDGSFDRNIGVIF